jgi:hypothetical protein
VNEAIEYQNRVICVGEEIVYQSLPADWKPATTTINRVDVTYLPNGIWWNGTDPTTEDTDQDGIKDKVELTAYTATLTVDGRAYTTISSIITDPTNPDTDGDGLTDGQERNGWKAMIAWFEGDTRRTKEITVYSDPRDGKNTGLDSDGDGITDYDETHPEENPDFAMMLQRPEYKKEMVFNPFVRDKIPPLIDEVSSEVIEEWGWGWVGIVYVYHVTHAWVRLKAKIYDINKLSEVALKVKYNTLTGDITVSQQYSGALSGGTFEADLTVDWLCIKACGYTIIVYTKDVAGNGVEYTQKVDGLFTGVLRFLENIWNAIVGALQKAWEAVQNAISKIIDWVIQQIEVLLNRMLEGAKAVLSPLLTQMKRTIDQISQLLLESIESAGRLFVDALFSGYFFYGIVALYLGIQTISSLISLYSVGLGALVGKAVSMVVVEIAKALFGGVISGVVSLASISMIIEILYLVKPKEDPFWREGVGLSMYSLGVVIAKLIVERPEGKGVLKEAFGLFLAVCGFILSIIQEEVALWLGLLVSGAGALITWLNKDIFDMLPISPLKDLEEVLSVMALLYSISQLTKYYGER